ncbi:MAG: GDP-mannose 4,6-dehydratase [Ignavibacteria bacterium]|nr:GDP-mannose 4,6-dehydratase [Ignavibacteria bacterium]MDH7527545.1 GDP-mannose 4,6-dehydratase [Ignavibacteria bacterium]
MNILVTGGAGFIASHIVDAFIENGHNVTIIDNLTTGRKENINPGAKFYEIDIRDDLTKIFDEGKFDVVNHHAAQIDVRRSVTDPIYDAGVNIIGTLNLLQNSIKFGVKKFMFASTGGAVYGEQDYFPADENHKQQPLSPYGISKLSVEKYLYFYKEVHGLKYTILRYANIYGPRQNPLGEAGVVCIFLDKILAGDQPIINGSGEQTRDYVYVKDVVKANLLTLNEEESDIYNVGTGIETSVNELFRLINQNFNNSIKEVHGPAKPGEQMRSVITSEKLFKKFGWKPSTKLEDGLRETIEYYKSLAK